MSQLFASGSQSIRVSALTSVHCSSNEHPGLISFKMDWLDLLAVQGTLKTLLQHHSSKASILQCSAFFTVQRSHPYSSVQFSSVQSLSHVWLFATPRIAASLSITNSWSPPKTMSIESMMPSNHLILCRSLLLLPSIFPRIRVFSNESLLQRSKYWSFSFSIRPSNEYLALISFRMDWLDLLTV